MNDGQESGTIARAWNGERARAALVRDIAPLPAVDVSALKAAYIQYGQSRTLSKLEEEKKGTSYVVRSDEEKLAAEERIQRAVHRVTKPGTAFVFKPKAPLTKAQTTAAAEAGELRRLAREKRLALTNGGVVVVDEGLVPDEEANIMQRVKTAIGSVIDHIKAELKVMPTIHKAVGVVAAVGVSAGLAGWKLGWFKKNRSNRF